MKMKNKTLSQAHERIIEWVGDDGEFIKNLSDEQARDMLNWLQENHINIELPSHIEKLAEYIQFIS
jgi:hypothetical protein